MVHVLEPTSGTRTAPGGVAAGVGAADVGAAGALGAASAGALGSAGAGADWLASGFGASVDSAGGADDSCVRPGAGTSTAPMRTTAMDKIGPWLRERVRGPADSRSYSQGSSHRRERGERIETSLD